MKKILGILAVAALVTPFLLAGGCAQKATPKVGGDLYRAVPKAEHERMYPHGHLNSLNQKCIYDERDATYFCQYEP